jgi:hypothetical protein
MSLYSKESVWRSRYPLQSLYLSITLKFTNTIWPTCCPYEEAKGHNLILPVGFVLVGPYKPIDSLILDLIRSSQAFQF